MREALDDGTIRIRRYRIDDVDELHPAARESIVEVGAWLPWLDEGYMRDDSRAWIEASHHAWEEGARFAFAVEEVGSGRYLGGVGLNQLNWAHRFANLGYWVRSSAMGRGVAPRAACLVARLGLDDLELTRLEILCAVENARSIRVAEKVGASREGVLANRLVVRDVAHDAVMFSITPGWTSPLGG